MPVWPATIGVQQTGLGETWTGKSRKKEPSAVKACSISKFLYADKYHLKFSCRYHGKLSSLCNQRVGVFLLSELHGSSETCAGPQLTHTFVVSPLFFG